MPKTFTDVDRARIELLRRQPFFANLIIHLPMKYDPKIPYPAGTDGKFIYYNDDFLKFKPIVMEGVICHEALHAALLHLWRKAGRDQFKFNAACDFSINPIVLDAGLELPNGALVNSEWKGFNAEKIYSLLPTERGRCKGNKKGEGEDGDGKGDQGGDWFCGGTGLAKDKEQNPSEAAHAEQQWKYRLAKAVTAVGRGHLPGGMEELVEELLYPEIPLELLFRRLITTVSGRGNYRLSPPNKKHLWRGFILPSTISDYVEFNACVDCSGSISHDEIRLFLGVIDKVAHEYQDFSVNIFIGDTEVNQEHSFTPFTKMVEAVMGRGGTDFKPFFERIEQRHLNRLPTIFLTDLDGNCPDEFPGQVFWVVPKDRYSEHSAGYIKFGEIIKISKPGKDGG